jgi:putative tributyrin esterase
MILAAPSDGLNGDGTGYLRYADTDYERWIVNDVVDCVQQTFPLHGTGAIGFSCRTLHGSVRRAAARHKFPERFRAISTHSSITHISQFDQFVRHSIHAGSMPHKESDILHWIRRNSDRLPALRFDCGRNDNLFKANERLHRELDSIGVAHQFASYDGEHNCYYWKMHLEGSLNFF